MTVNKVRVRSALILLPAILSLSTLANADTAGDGPAGSGGSTVKQAPGGPTSPGAAAPQQGGATGGAAPASSGDDDAPVTRGLMPEGNHPSVDPTQPWPRRGAGDDMK